MAQIIFAVFRSISISVQRKMSYLGASRSNLWYVHVFYFKLRKNYCKYWHFEASFLWHTNMHFWSYFYFGLLKLKKILKLKCNSGNAKCMWFANVSDYITHYIYTYLIKHYNINWNTTGNQFQKPQASTNLSPSKLF